MLEEYQIITLSEETFARSERFQSGAEQKYKIPWSQVNPDREQLAIFKIDNEPREVSRVWIEKLAGELAIAMGLPTATYEMCETKDNRRGIASPSYLRNGVVEQPGVVLMQEVFDTNSVLYTVENTLTVFDRLDISLPSGYTPPPEIGTAKDLFIGYLLHSYWIDDPDFHNRNWGTQTNPNGERELLPNYDYGRALVDFPIVNNRLEVFAERLAGTRTCAFVNNDGKEIKMDEMVEILNQISPNITQYWSDRIAQASAEQLNPICDLFPSGWGSPERIEFARVFINYNSQRLEQLTEASIQIVQEVENQATIDYPNPDNSPKPPNDSPEPPTAPVRTPPKPPTPPNSPEPTNSSDRPPDPDSPPNFTNSTQSPGNTNMSIKLINYDLINRRPQIGLTTGVIKTELREGTAIEQLIRRQGLLKDGQPPTFYAAPYSKYINVDDLTNHAPEGTLLLATSQTQLYFGSPEVKAAIKTLMPLETQIPGYARGLFASGQNQILDRPLRVLVVDHETGRNDSGIPEKLIRNIAADGASIIDRSVGKQMKLIEDTGLSQVRGYSLNPQIGSYYIKGTVTPLNLQKYFATHGLDLDVDLILTTSMLKGLGGGKLDPEIGIHEVDPTDLFITKTSSLHQTTVKLGSVQDLYAQGLAKDIAIPVQTAIGDLQQKQLDLISLAEDYVRTFKISQQRDVLKGKPEVELPGNIAFIDTILESKNWGLLELPSVRANLQEYVDGQIKNIKTGAIQEMRGEFRPIVVCGELKHNQIAGVGLTTGDKHVALRFPVLNRGQVQAVEVNNAISFLLNPELEGIIPDAIYIGRQTLAEIEQDDPQTYEQIIEEFGSIEAAQASWRTNLEAMKADFDGDQIAIFAEKDYPNFYAEVVDNLTPEKLMHFVSKDEKQQIESDNLPRIVVERLKHYVGVINTELGKINKLYSSLDFIIASTDGELSTQDKVNAEKLQAETLQAIFDAYQKYRSDTESLITPGESVFLTIPKDLQTTFEQFAPFYSVDFLKTQLDNPRAQANYLYKLVDPNKPKPIEQLLGAYQAKTLVATPISQKKGIVFPPDLIKDMQQVKYMKLTQIREGKADLALLVDYLDRYASIHERLSKIIDLSQPIVGKTLGIDIDTNLPITQTESINLPPNHPYDPDRIATYLRDYQTVVLRKCIEIVARQNQRAVDFVKSGVKPEEGAVYAVTDKLPNLNVGIELLNRFIIEENHQDRLSKSSSQTLNSLIGQLRSVPVRPEIKAMVASFRDDYQYLQTTIALENQALKEFKYGKPIVLNIYTTDGSKTVVKDCDVKDVNIFRYLQGKGSIDIKGGVVDFHPDNSTSYEGIRHRYSLGSTAKTSAQIESRQRISEFEFESLHNRIDELKAESREILANFRAEIDRRGWDRDEVFAATAQLVGEKAISQDFLLSALPQTLNKFVLEQGAGQIVLDTEYPQYLAKPTEYLVTTGLDGAKNLRAKVELEGKSQWIEAGKLTAYSIQLLDKTHFHGTIAPNYNTVTFKSPTEQSTQQSILVGKLTSQGKELIDSGKVQELRVVRQLNPSYKLKFEDIDIKIINCSPELLARLGENKSTELTLEQLKVYDNKFSATTRIDGEIHYLSGVNFDKFDKKNRENVTEIIRKERFEMVTVVVERQPELDFDFQVYNGETKIGEITQPAEQKYWGARIAKLESGNAISMHVSSTIPKHVGYSVKIDQSTLFNSNVWQDVEPARTYQRLGKDAIQSPKLNPQELQSEEFKSEQVKNVLELASRNLRTQADLNCFPESFSAKVRMPIVSENGLGEVERLKLVLPDNKIELMEAYFNKPNVNISYTKLERGIPETYEESRRGYNVLLVNPDDLSPTIKTAISKKSGKPISQADYQAKLAQIPTIREYTPVKINSLKQWLGQYPQSLETPVLDLNQSKPVPYALKSITGEVQTRFKGKALAIGKSIVFEFGNDRRRDTAAYHLGLPIKAQLPGVDGKTRYFAVVEAGALQTYLNDRAVNHVLVKDGIKRDNPILTSYGATKDWTKLAARAQTDIVMGYTANKYIGIPLETKSRTTMYRDAWGVNANSTTYNSTDIVMVSGNRTGKDTSNSLLARHFRTQYVPLLAAAIAGKAKILVGNDTGIDRMVREYLTQAGYDLHLNSAGILEATTQLEALIIEQSIPAYIPTQEETEQEQEESEMEMAM